MRLHYDSYAKREGFPTTENYMKSRFRLLEEIRFEDPETFLSLVNEGLVGLGSFVRTSDDGHVDRNYKVGADGEFIGVHIDAYPLEVGVYSFENVFDERKISDGYVVYGRTFERDFFEWLKINK